jgi:hypothetical protein
MFHSHRPHRIIVFATLDELAAAVAKGNHCGCFGGQAPLDGHAVQLLNDSIGSEPYRFQEFGVVVDGVQVDSLTVSDLSAEDIAKYVRDIVGDPSGWCTFQLFAPPHPEDGPCPCCE